MKIKQLLELVDGEGWGWGAAAVVSLPVYPAMASVDGIKVLGGSPVLAAVLPGYDVQYLRKTDRQTH